MYRLDRFGVDDLVRCSDALRQIGDGANTMVEVAQRITDHLQGCLVDAHGEPACALVRLYRTVRSRDLDAALAQAAERVSAEVGQRSLKPHTPCLTLLGTSGIEPAWNDRTRSVAHAAIPLTDAAAVARFPMIAALLTQLGVAVADLVAPPDPVKNLRLHHRDYDVFHVPDARGSPLVPAQDHFVARYGIRSVVGFGGVLPSGDVFAVLLFSTVPVSADVADLLRSLGLSVKAAIVPLTFQVFEPAGAERR